MKDAGTTTEDLIERRDACTQTDLNTTTLDPPCNSPFHDEASRIDDHDLDEDSDTTTLDSPCNSPPHDHKIEQGSGTDTHDLDKDSDATTLDQEHASSSDGSYTDIHELDPDYDGPCYPSQACFGLHGVSYTPPGWRRRRVKRRKLMEPIESESDIDQAKKDEDNGQD